MRSAAIGPFQGMSESARAADCAVDHGNIGFVRLIGGKENADDLHLVEKTAREERAARAVAQARRENLLLGGTAFTLEEAAGNATGGGVFLAVIDSKRKIVLTRFHGRGDRGGDKDGGFTDGDRDGAVGEFCEGASRELDAKSGNGDSMFLIHGSDGSPRSRRNRASCAGGGTNEAVGCAARLSRSRHGISTVFNRISLPQSLIARNFRLAPWCWCGRASRRLRRSWAADSTTCTAASGNVPDRKARVGNDARRSADRATGEETGYLRRLRRCSRSLYLARSCRFK